jgi:hypothetical protein
MDDNFVNLSQALSAPAELAYNHRESQKQPAQIALNQINKTLSKLIPSGYLVKNSGIAHRNLPHIPWVAILDSDETKSTQTGIFIVYLYRADMSEIFLSLNQGYTAHENRVKLMPKVKKGTSLQNLALNSITRETKVLKSKLEENFRKLKNLEFEIDLHSGEKMAMGYMAGHMAGFSYKTGSMPTEQVLLEHLEIMYSLYSSACEVADENTSLQPETWTTPSGAEYKRKIIEKKKILVFSDFKPKDSSPVLINQNSNAINKDIYMTRKHEKLIIDFVAYIRKFDFEATNDIKEIGKRDLLIKSKQGQELLIEAKTVKTDGEAAVRDAIGQLFAYQYEYYQTDDRPILVGLFNLQISEFWQGLLQELGIEWIYQQNGDWYTSKGLKQYF